MWKQVNNTQDYFKTQLKVLTVLTNKVLQVWLLRASKRNAFVRNTKLASSEQHKHTKFSKRYKHTFQYKIAQTLLYHPTQTRLNGCRVLSVDKCWSVFTSNCWEAWWEEQESWLSYTWDLHKHQSNCWQLLFYANLMFRRELHVAKFNCRVCIAYYALHTMLTSSV